MQVANTIIERLRGGLIVSCQARGDNPLAGSAYMLAMARAAVLGGAVGVRVEGPEDIRAVTRVLSVPVIGLYKVFYPGSDVYITPTLREVELVLACGAHIVALDATCRSRPAGRLPIVSEAEAAGASVASASNTAGTTGVSVAGASVAGAASMANTTGASVAGASSTANITGAAELRQALNLIHAAGRLAMADISTLDEALTAESLGFDLVSTTMSGYTPYSTQSAAPDLALVRAAASKCRVPVIAEGRYSEPAAATKALQAGAWAVTVGTAITNPTQITRRFVAALSASS